MSDPTVGVDPTLIKLGTSLVGSLVSLRFVSGTIMERILMFVGGASVSYLGTGPVSRWIGGGEDTLGLIGFFLGMLGMTIVAKIYEIILAFDSKQIATDIWAWLVKKWNA